jgi:hypothetical protein
MQVFIDESGDAGFKLEKNSSRFFVVAAIIFDDNLEAKKCALRIKELRRELGLGDNFEFKFNKSHARIRSAFLQVVAGYNFRIRCIVVDKTRIRSNELRTETKSFYSFTAKTLLKYTRGTITNASVKIDGSGNRTFRREFVSYLRRELNTNSGRIVSEIKLADSKQNVLIQLADMVAGATRRSYEEGVKDQFDYKKIIARKYEDCWNFK